MWKGHLRYSMEKPPHQLGSFWLQVTEDLTNSSLVKRVFIVSVKGWWPKD